MENETEKVLASGSLDVLHEAIKLTGKPVYSPRGLIVGRVGEDPKVEEGPSAQERIEKGLQDQEDRIEAAMIPVVETLTGYALEVKRLYDAASQFSYRDRLKAEGKAKELKVKFDATKKELAKLQGSLCIRHGGERSQSADAFVRNLERQFTEAPFVLYRF